MRSNFYSPLSLAGLAKHFTQFTAVLGLTKRAPKKLKMCGGRARGPAMHDPVTAHHSLICARHNQYFVEIGLRP